MKGPASLWLPGLMRSSREPLWPGLRKTQWTRFGSIRREFGRSTRPSSLDLHWVTCPGLLPDAKPKEFSFALLFDGPFYLPRADATKGMKSGPQVPRTESRPRSDAGKKWPRGTPETRDMSALGAVQPYAGPGMPLHAPGARDSKPRVQTRGSPRLVPCAPRLSFSAAPAGHFPACAQHKAGTRGPPVAAAPAAPGRGFGRGGPHRSGAPGSGARKCTQTINFPRPPTHPARRSEAKQGPPPSPGAPLPSGWRCDPRPSAAGTGSDSLPRASRSCHQGSNGSRPLRGRLRCGPGAQRGRGRAWRGGRGRMAGERLWPPTPESLHLGEEGASECAGRPLA